MICTENRIPQQIILSIRRGMIILGFCESRINSPFMYFIIHILVEQNSTSDYYRSPDDYAVVDDKW